MNRRVVASVASAAVLAGGGAAIATAASADGSSRAQHVVAHDVQGGPFHMEYNATRPAGAAANQATGVFDARLLLGGNRLVHVQGPVTCLNVKGNSSGMYYPITSSEPALFKKGVRGIYIYMHVDGKGHTDGVNFVQSVRPYAADCPPIPDMVPATGHGEIDS